MRPWRLIIDPPREGGLNMAIDQGLLLDAERADEPRTVLRIYRWSAPTLSLGYGQKPEEVADLEVCRRRGVSLVRRPTGGRAVLHDCEMTYAVLSNDPECFPMASRMETYRRIAQALRYALQEVGVSAVFEEGAGRPGAAARAGGENYLRQRTPCFTSPARYELLCRGRKIIGSAQRRLRRAFLQHGSLLLDCDYPLLAAVTRTEEDYLRRRVTSLQAERGRRVAEAEAETALLVGFEQQFGVIWTPQAVADAELAAAQTAAPAFVVRD